MTTVEDLVTGQVAQVQDALRETSERMRRVALPDTIAAAQRAVAQAQEALAILSVGLCDAETPTSVDGFVVDDRGPA